MDERFRRPRGRTAPRRSAAALASGLWTTLLVACSTGACPSGVEDRGEEPRMLVGGIQVNEPDMEHWLDTLQEVGLNTLSVTVYARQGRWDGGELSSDAPEEWVVSEIRAARERGLATVLVLRVALEHALEENLFLWHGMIQPRDAATLEEWFAAYGAFVERWARIAAAEGVEVLGIGSELNSLTATRAVEELPVLEEYYLNADKQAADRERLLAFEDDVERRHLKAGWGKTYDSLPGFLHERAAAHYRWAEQVTFGSDVEAINRRRKALDDAWRNLIARVRQVYPGRLTYAANFDQYPMVGFWDALDAIGINAYFPLRDGKEEASRTADLLPVFERSWTEVLGDLEELRRERGLSDMPVIFTELGYTQRAGSTIHPWAAEGFELMRGGGVAADEHPELVVYDRRPVDVAERALAVRALRRSLERFAPSLLGGVLYWKLSTVPEHREIEPFVLVIGGESADPLQRELSALAEHGGAVR